MNRRLIGTLVLSGLLFFLLISSMNVARAVPLQQETEQADDTAETAEATTGVDATELLTDTEEGQPLAEPLQITIRQRLPISIDLGQLGLTSEGVTITGALPLELELTIDFRVTDTLTSTVPSTLTLINAGDVLTRLPITMTLGDVTDTLVVVIPQLVLQESEGLTTTETLTESEEITSTPEVTVTLPITAEVEPEQVPEISATPTVTSVEDVTTTETVTPGQTWVNSGTNSGSDANRRRAGDCAYIARDGQFALRACNDIRPGWYCISGSGTGDCSDFQRC